ncbi:MAG: hypothetical protein ACRDT8_03445 [Micromonosporaceae bacterium]
MTTPGECREADPATADRLCPRCGWPDDDPVEVVSRHHTSAGLIVYTRCVCGLLTARQVTWAGRGGAVVRGAAPACPVW